MPMAPKTATAETIMASDQQNCAGSTPPRKKEMAPTGRPQSRMMMTKLNEDSILPSTRLALVRRVSSSSSSVCCSRSMEMAPAVSAGAMSAQRMPSTIIKPTNRPWPISAMCVPTSVTSP
ncbi:MAG: hypothetical protein BWY76_03031 [bacterium ADurb.Bin429]|nr:MAG: hypothetical protein BWY76_03031 [bacterium ADurb.Bin429]